MDPRHDDGAGSAVLHERDAAGKPDFKQLRHPMQKPAMALAMSFGDDPMLGMSADHLVVTPRSCSLRQCR
jgi:hypothetical protein